MLQATNLGIRFALEICALLIYGYWGYKAGSNSSMKIVIAVGVVLAVAVLWGTFGSPNAPIRLSPMNHLLFEGVVFGLPILLLVVVHNHSLAIVYGIVVVLNRIFMYVWDQ
jgi:hypothetical protein